MGDRCHRPGGQSTNRSRLCSSRASASPQAHERLRVALGLARCLPRHRVAPRVRRHPPRPLHEAVARLASAAAIVGTRARCVGDAGFCYGPSHEVARPQTLGSRARSASRKPSPSAEHREGHRREQRRHGKHGHRPFCHRERLRFSSSIQRRPSPPRRAWLVLRSGGLNSNRKRHPARLWLPPVVKTWLRLSAQMPRALEQALPRTKALTIEENRPLETDKSSAEFRWRNAVSAAAAAME